MFLTVRFFGPQHSRKGELKACLTVWGGGVKCGRDGQPTSGDCNSRLCQSDQMQRVLSQEGQTSGREQLRGGHIRSLCIGCVKQVQSLCR